MPGDELQSRPASASVESAAAGNALLVRYEWEHPDDGRQSGILLVGSPDGETADEGDGGDGGVHATWIDSWHQKPGPMLLTGAVASDGACELSGTYADEWRWEISLHVAGGMTMTMRNVVPESAGSADDDDPMPAGPYDVMVMSLTS